MLKGGILGLGNIALGAHVATFAQNAFLRESAEIVAAADLSAQNRKRASELYPRLRLYETAEALIANEIELDFLDICTPPDTHRELIEQAVGKNWHILCEKPLVINEADLKAIEELLTDPKIVFKPVHQYLHSPHWQAVTDFCNDEGITPYHFQARVLRTRANQGNAAWQPLWRTDPKQSGGGIIFDHGVHLFYLAVSLLGSPQKITALTRNFKHSYAVEDTALIIIEHANGISEISLSWAAQRRQIEFLVLGDEAEIFVEENHVTLFHSDLEEKRISIPVGISGGSTHQSWYPPLLNNFVKKIINRDYGSEKLHEALTATRCALAAYQSAAEQRSISF